MVARFSEEELEVICDIAPCDVYPADGVRHGETFEDRHRVRYAISRIENDTCCSARRIPALPG